MSRFIIFCVFLTIVSANEQTRVVELDEGAVIGEKYWNGDYFEFYGVPYATAPSGRDKFKAPLPVKRRKNAMQASTKNIICQQVYYTGEDDDITLYGKENCLTMNLMVPNKASEKNLVPVLVYIHSGAFAGGNGNMARTQYLSRHDVIVITFNYRLGAIGFACLGTEETPGNAALKDQVAALRWINKNIKKFGGNPKKVTVAGFSVGATMAELLALSKTTTGLIDKIILESGSALAPFAINRDPVSTVKNVAVSIGYNDTGNLKDLNEFFLNAPVANITAKSLNFFLTNSTFGFAPCIENVFENTEAFLTESPLDILSKGGLEVSVLTGFSNMEGISRESRFEEWSELMNKDFSQFLPADLAFKDDKTRDNFINEIKKYYFKNKEVSLDNVQGYVDYFSDSMFKYSILKSAKLHAARSKKSVYLYEFSYVGKLNTRHNFVDRIDGASHRDQTAYILDFFTATQKVRDLNTRDRLTYMWTDFVKYDDPTAYESPLIDFKWLKYSNEQPNYLSINDKLEVKRDLLANSYEFWNNVYEKYYWNPSAPKK
ncbi:venom carboxylesterase-6-like [Achroia grisella]|uniref:venom carboxylesterase-6-like n=1 Tax=Achroia grisella TaxID=688607 RepID=UPI0027D1FEF7|nr:venom carboxylesterase-6-like [Achroia grisella]